MNYFNYFTEIEDAFVRRRGKHLLLSPLDWALIESWKEIGVPLHVALRGIERAFDSWEARPRKRTVKSLLYCQEEVEAQYAEWNEARVGHTEEEGPAEPRVEREQLPFSRDSILEHLNLAKGALLSILEQRRRHGEDNFSEVLERSTRLLEELIDDFSESLAPDTRRLEDSLTGLERMLSDALKTIISKEQLESFRAEIVEQLRPYRAHMNKAVYQQTLDNLLLKRLREEFAVPRLSLFYL
ncbi:MAG TPA: hypothetical protein VI750_04420 [Pyrinomonadaceae bacterium]|nr:hypothetical protein [Pyrinomonadaceae bacterium]